MKFLDTNVLVYFADARNAGKQRQARSILAEALDGQSYMISTQVLNEFSNIALKKLFMTEDEVKEYITDFQAIITLNQRVEWTCRALEIRRRYHIQFYDSLLLAAAEAGGCDEILTEDLSDGQYYCGIKATNPFASR